MTRRVRHILAIVALWSLTWAVVGFAAGKAFGHEGYADWKQANGTSCCNEQVEHADGHVTGDCRPTRAYKDDFGQWRAWDGRTWLLVPERAVLPPDLKSDGRSHLCEAFGTVFCFSPSEPKI